MSQAPMGTSGEQPTEEELRAYLMELRKADPAEFLMQAVNILVTGAQAKIGLGDGRLLIDGVAGIVAATGDRLPEQLRDALGNAVAQLQAAQVQAEKELAATGGAQAGSDAEGTGEGGAAQAPAAPGAAPGAAGAGPTISEPQQKMTDRLWVPGKGTPPPTR